MSNTAIIILNWNGWEDTLKCIQSIGELKEDEYIFIVDNGSTDNSYTYLKKAFQQNYSEQYIAVQDKDVLVTDFSKDKKYYLIKNDKNVGFGAGNNVVLKKLKELNADFEYSWLLNNDLKMEKNALKELKQTIALNPNVSCVGSLILNLPDNGKIQCCGAKYYKFIGISKLVYKNKEYTDASFENVSFDYINGASLMLRIQAVEEVGFFDERFFLYSEEFDLQLRLKKKGYKLEINPNSVVYHKLAEGTNKNKHLFYYYYNMSSVIMSKKHYGIYTAFVLINLPWVTIKRAFPNVTNIFWGVKGIWKGLYK